MRDIIYIRLAETISMQTAENTLFHLHLSARAAPLTLPNSSAYSSLSSESWCCGAADAEARHPLDGRDGAVLPTPRHRYEVIAAQKI